MYKVIFARGVEKYKEPLISKDGFSNDFLYELYKAGYDFVVISTFSNHIKIPYTKMLYAHEQFYFKKYVFKDKDFCNSFLEDFLSE